MLVLFSTSKFYLLNHFVSQDACLQCYSNLWAKIPSFITSDLKFCLKAKSQEMFCFSKHVAESFIICQISWYFVLHANQIPKDLNYSQHSTLTLIAPRNDRDIPLSAEVGNYSVEKLVIFRDLHLQLQLFSCRKPHRRGKQTTTIFRGLWMRYFINPPANGWTLWERKLEWL